MDTWFLSINGLGRVGKKGGEEKLLFLTFAGLYWLWGQGMLWLIAKRWQQAAENK